MYFPVTFSDDTSSPIVYENPKGTQYVYAPTVTLPCSPTPAAPTDEDVANIEFLREPMDGITTEVIKDALTKIDPDCSMQKWVEYGMGLKHQFGEAGYELWDEWSSTGKKYKGDQETRKRWDSFRGATKDRPPITLRTVVKSAVEAGWDNAVFDEQVYEKTKEWIMSDSRSTEELLDTGAVRIAKIAGVLSPGRKAALVNTLAKAMRKDGMKGPTPSEILKDIKRISKLNGSTKGEEPPPDWTTGMAFMTAPNLFFRYNDNRKMRPEVVNQIYISPDPELRPSDYLIHTVGIPVVEQTIYDPSQPPGVIFHNGVPFINTYQQSYAPSDYTHLAEASRLIVAHAHNMMGKWEYARTLINFTATLVQQPGRKIRWAPLIQGGVGCGKGLWGKFISCAIGATNVQQLSGENILEGTHNSYATGAQLSNINELDTFGYANRSRTADKMKPMITDDEISVRNLYEPVRTVKNTTNYIIFTNRMNALAVHSDDRRYFVVNSPLQLPEDIAALGANYFEEMYRFTQQHPGAIRAFFESWPIDDDFNPDGRAPVTPFLREMAEMSCSPLMSEVRHLLEDQPHPLLRKDLVSLTALRSLIAAERVASFSDQALSAVLRECGYTSVGRHVVEGAKHSLWTRRLVGDAATVAQQRMDYL
jgi:hypothetical protein